MNIDAPQQASYKHGIRMSLAAITRVAPLSGMLRSMSTRGLVPEFLWKRLPVEGAFQVEVPGGGSFYYSSDRRDGIGRSLFWRGLAHDSTTIDTFLSRCKKAEVIFDIGANSGLFTLLACSVNPRVKVVAFEPSPRIRRQLLDLIAANGFEERCCIRQEAVSDVGGSAIFHIPDESSTSASLNPDGYHGLRGEKVVVKTVTIDSIAAEYASIDLIKIDVEGFEDKVLEGMHETVRRFAPEIILECNVGGPASKINLFLKSHEYKFFHLADRLVPVDEIDPSLDPKYSNWLCSPNNIGDLS